MPHDEEIVTHGSRCLERGDDNSTRGEQEVRNRTKDHEVERQLTLHVFDDRPDGEQAKHVERDQLEVGRAGRGDREPSRDVDGSEQHGGQCQH